MVASINMCRAREERERNLTLYPRLLPAYAVIQSPFFPFTVWCCPFSTHISWLLWAPWHGAHFSSLLHWEGGWKVSPSTVEQPSPFCHICMLRSCHSFVPLASAEQLVLIQWMELSVLSLMYWKNNACFQCSCQQQLLRGIIHILIWSLVWTRRLLWQNQVWFRLGWITQLMVEFSSRQHIPTGWCLSALQ